MIINNIMFSTMERIALQEAIECRIDKLEGYIEIFKGNERAESDFKEEIERLQLIHHTIEMGD